MSLTQEQKSRTRQELRANQQICPLDDRVLCKTLGWTPQQLADTLDVNAGSSPAQVWLLRDFLEQAVSDLGGTPVPFTVLTEDARASSERWFGPCRIPPTPARKRED